MGVKKTTFIVSCDIPLERNIAGVEFISNLEERRANQKHLNRLSELSRSMSPGDESKVFVTSADILGGIASLVCGGPTRPGSFPPHKIISVFCLNDIPTHIVINE